MNEIITSPNIYYPHNYSHENVLVWRIVTQDRKQQKEKKKTLKKNQTENMNQKTY